MMVEPENNNKEIYNINNPSTNTANKQNPIETTTKTTVVPTPPAPPEILKPQPRPRRKKK